MSPEQGGRSDAFGPGQFEKQRHLLLEDMFRQPLEEEEQNRERQRHNRQKAYVFGEPTCDFNSIEPCLLINRDGKKLREDEPKQIRDHLERLARLLEHRAHALPAPIKEIGVQKGEPDRDDE